jgi:glycosyltransferase involved in cell wall biosynthesis
MHFSDVFPAGETQIAYGYAVHLARMGHRVTVFSPRVTLLEEIEGLRAIELCPGNTGAAEKSYAAEKLLWWKFSVRTLRQAKKLARTEGVDVIHHLMPAHSGKFSLLSGLGIPFVYGPMLLTWNGGNGGPEEPDPLAKGTVELLRAKFADRLDMHVGKRLFGRTLSEAGAVMVSTDKLRDSVGPVHAGRIFPLQYGVDTAVFHPEDDSNSTEPVILYLGLLNRRKGIYDLVHAFSIMSARVDAKLTIVGGGDITGVRTLASNLGVSDRVEVLGEVPHSQVAEHFRRCTLFCLPSHGEPFGMVLLQAMSSGKAVVATRGGGVEDIVDDKEIGLLVDQKDPAGLAGAMETLLLDEETRKRMGCAAREKAVREFDWSVITERLVSIYEKTIGG